MGNSIRFNHLHFTYPHPLAAILNDSTKRKVCIFADTKIKVKTECKK